MRAMWRDVVLAESDDTVVIGRSCASMRSRHWGILPGEGNHCFPADSLGREHFRPSDHHTICPWKGSASYLDVIVGGEVNPNAAGITPPHRQPRRRSRIGWRSGTASRSWPEVLADVGLVIPGDA